LRSTVLRNTVLRGRGERLDQLIDPTHHRAPLSTPVFLSEEPPDATRVEVAVARRIAGGVRTYVRTPPK